MARTIVSDASPADRKWGYRFGVDGIVSCNDAREMLGGLSRSVLDKRAAQGLVRRGKEGGRTVFCIRSLKMYLNSIEN